MSGNAANWFVDRHVEKGRGDKTAFCEIFEGGRALTYGKLTSASIRLVSKFTPAGLALEQRAAMFVLNQDGCPIIFRGALISGVMPFAINTLLFTGICLGRVRGRIPAVRPG